jgi:zinc transport system substrate-binding protein
MRKLFSAIILLCLLPVLGLSEEKKPESPAKNSPPVVVVTIKPLHSLVSAVMGELGKPGLLIDGKISEHDYKITPEDTRKLQGADIIFFDSLDLEKFLIGTIPSLRDGAVAVELAASDGVVRQNPLNSDLEDDERRQLLYDPHVWLSPTNAIAMVKQIKRMLSIRDPKNRGVYELNAKNYINKISKSSEKITLQLSPYKNLPFITFHDAYGYFVQHYGLNQIASVAAYPDAKLNAERISDLNSTIRRKHVYCLFADPAFDEEALRKLIKNPERIKITTLDPIGNGLEKGEGEYLRVMEAVASNMLSCFGDGKI